MWKFPQVLHIYCSRTGIISKRPDDALAAKWMWTSLQFISLLQNINFKSRVCSQYAKCLVFITEAVGTYGCRVIEANWSLSQLPLLVTRQNCVLHNPSCSKCLKGYLSMYILESNWQCFKRSKCTIIVLVYPSAVILFHCCVMYHILWLAD